MDLSARLDHDNKGFSLIELVIVFSVVVVLITLVMMSVPRTYNTSSFAATHMVMINDMKAQQTKAMLQDTGGATVPQSYGVYFASDKYVLFRGSSYVPGNASNFIVPLEGMLQLTAINFPSSTVIFSPLSGEVSGYVSGSDSLILQDTGVNIQKTIVINRYGVIAAVF